MKSLETESANAIWQCWLKEYVPSLNNGSKWLAVLNRELRTSLDHRSQHPSWALPLYRLTALIYENSETARSATDKTFSGL